MSNIWSLIEPVVEGMGYEVVDIDFRPHPTDGLLRIYIDKSDGVLLEDCELVSKQISSLLDVEDPIPGQFNLEISSPGMDRPLRKIQDFERFSGEKVKIKLSVPTLEGQRNFSGKLMGLQDQEVILEVDGETHYLPLDSIEKARLVPQF